MSEAQIPTGYAAATKVALDSVKTPFGTINLVLIFFGLALVGLAFGGGEFIPPETRGNIMYLLIGLMVFILFCLIGLRLWKPKGLTALPPPQPETKDIVINETSSFP